MSVNNINSCIPLNNSEEFYINDFLEFYNYENKENYSILYSPENDFRHTPQPEFILSNGVLNVVIERKIFCYPENLIHKHKMFHVLSDIIHANLSEYFSDDLYSFKIDCLDIPSNLASVNKLGAQVVDTILKDRHAITKNNMIVSEEKPDWKFCYVPYSERDEFGPDKGIVIFETDIHKLFAVKCDVSQITEMLKEKLNIVNLKFKNYRGMKSVFLIQLYNSFNVESIIDQIKHLRKNFDNIEEIWIAEECTPEYELPFFEYRKI